MDGRAMPSGEHCRLGLREWAKQFGWELRAAFAAEGTACAGFLADAVELLAEEINRQWCNSGIVVFDEEFTAHAESLISGWLTDDPAILIQTAYYLLGHPDGPYVDARDLIAVVDRLAYESLAEREDEDDWEWTLIGLPPTLDELYGERDEEDLPEGFGWPPLDDPLDE